MRSITFLREIGVLTISDNDINITNTKGDKYSLVDILDVWNMANSNNSNSNIVQSDYHTKRYVTINGEWKQINHAK